MQHIQISQVPRLLWMSTLRVCKKTFARAGLLKKMLIRSLSMPSCPGQANVKILNCEYNTKTDLRCWPNLARSSILAQDGFSAGIALKLDTKAYQRHHQLVGPEMLEFWQRRATLSRTMVYGMVWWLQKFYKMEESNCWEQYFYSHLHIDATIASKGPPKRDRQ